MLRTKIVVPPPYDFGAVMDRLSLDSLNRVEIEQNTIFVPIVVDGRNISVKIESTGTIDSPAFEVDILDEADEATVLEELKRLFQWNELLPTIHDHFASTNLRSLFQEHRGTPLVLEFDFFRCLLKSIIHQQLSLKVAHRLTDRFVKTYGVEHNGVWFYPSPDRLCSLNYEELKELGLSTRKSEYIIDISKAIVSGELDLSSLRNQSDEEVIQTLVKIRGIGPWTAQNFLMFALGRLNMFPKADIGLQNAIRNLFSLSAKPTLDEMESLSKEWQPYASYASLYLWRSIE
ncbi:DNA-3-methyladenine glycosylase family protein [Priestia koreensis]|uniref:DNA-3-methyladenine glycosylase II n=1 Tax=Priestia koreensis TaxID=284581 RepID=A0A0M0KRP5_9BACI|nr:DNA-3-methyladenine glycosylase [Priestia koreensis]KOO41068.1 DNA-3-methyladenine glycosylase [Priestia koreensis]